MLQKVYMIYDKVAAEAGPLVCCKNDGIALRIFLKAMGDTGVPEDYQLYAVGEYYTESGILIGYDDKVPVKQMTEVEA